MSVTDKDNDSGIDSTSPIYMHPSDNPGAMRVSVSFSGIDYRSWRGRAGWCLSVKNKLGFINGEFKRPERTSASSRQWDWCDDSLTPLILNSLDKYIADSVKYASDAAELWKVLEDQYVQTNGTKLYLIQKDIIRRKSQAKQEANSKRVHLSWLPKWFDSRCTWQHWILYQNEETVGAIIHS